MIDVDDNEVASLLTLKEEIFLDYLCGTNVTARPVKVKGRGNTEICDEGSRVRKVLCYWI